MRASLNRTLEHLKQWEGGYVDHPKDPGGCTNLGITLGTYRRLVKPNGTCKDLRRMGWDTAASIYVETYWAECGSDSLPPGVDLHVCDMGVNAGPKTAVRLLQRVIGVGQDGIVGPVTSSAAWDQDQSSLIAAYAGARLSYYRSLRRLWKTFGKGWTNRNRAATSAALELLEAAADEGVFDPTEHLPGTIRTTPDPRTIPNTIPNPWGLRF